MKELKFIALTLVCALTFHVAVAQVNTYQSAEDSDPDATRLLNKLKAKYEGFDNMKMDFNLEIEFPEEDKIVQKGNIFREGKKFYMDFEQQTVVSNGDKVWIHLKNNNEVQIYDAESMADEENFMSPENLLKLYDSDAFVFAISDEVSQEGRTVAFIECKPIDRDSEFSKMRLTVDTKNIDMVSVKAFSKDGSRYTFINNALTSNLDIPSSKFEFKTTDFPDIYVEDMREN